MSVPTIKPDQFIVTPNLRPPIGALQKPRHHDEEATPRKIILLLPVKFLYTVLLITFYTLVY